MLHMIQSMAAMNECCVNVVVQEARFSAFDLSFRVLILPSPIIVIQDLYLCCPLFDDIAVLSVGFRSQQKAFQVRPPPPVWVVILNIFSNPLV